jgi:nucleolar protein 56
VNRSAQKNSRPDMSPEHFVKPFNVIGEERDWTLLTEAPGGDSDIEALRQKSIAQAEQAIREASSRPDLHLVQAIQALDDADKFLNIAATRATEWYGLHFPEVGQIVQDNLALCKLIIELGTREEFSTEKLTGRGMSDKKVEAIVIARDRSKGGTISASDMARIRALSEIAIGLNSLREGLNGYVESQMKRVAPNVSEVAGATIGARLMAKAGGLDRLAVLPASTIQILGAEKALFRAMRTGARPPKHGILFQHQAVHLAPKWQRGKIARTLANKIAIAARVDYYRGSEEPSIKAGLDRRIESIKERYKESPRRPEREERRGGDARQGRRQNFRRR